jgi:hypothetical protein
MSLSRWLRSLVSRPHHSHRAGYHLPLRGCEALEARYALAGLDVPAADLTALLLRVGGKDVWIKESETPVVIAPGAALEVAGALIDVQGELVQTGGVLQMEGYLRTSDKEGLGEFDYDDGRFSAGLPVEAAAADEVHAGLSGDWVIAAGHNCLAIALVHYVGDDVTVTDRFFVQIQTTVPDFVLLAGIDGGDNKIKVGEQVHLAAAFANLGQGSFTTFVEADIYHESDLATPVWVGTLAGTVGRLEYVRGRLENDNDQDPFDKTWRPDRAGTYTVKAYVDPEHDWLELSELNNVFVFKITVAAKGKGD